MRKLAITITTLLLCAVTALMLMSVGVIPVPEAFRRPVEQPAALPAAHHSTLHESTKYSAEGKPRIVIDNPRGNILVRGAAVEQVEITMFVEASAHTAQRAQEILDGISLAVTTLEEENRLLVSMPRLEPDEQARADLTIWVPGEMDLELRLGLGNVQVTSIQGELQAYTHLGDIDLQDYEGSAHLETHLGDIHVDSSRFTEKLTAISHLGNINIAASLAQSSVLETALGDLHLHLPADESYLLEGTVELGSIHIGVPFDGEQHEHSVQGTIGQGERRGSISARLALGSFSVTK